MLPRSSVSYQFQAVLTAFYCAATPEGHGYLSVSPDTSRSNAVPSRCLYAEHYSRHSNGDTLRGAFVFGFQGTPHGFYTAAFEVVARSSVCCVCLVWYGYIVAAGTGKVKRFSAFFHDLASCTMWEGLHCASVTLDTENRETAVKASGRLCKAFYRLGG